jgi:membrane protein implicated in regulation of membrane protease activity
VETVLLGLFLFGLAFTVLSFLLGVADLDLSLPDFGDLELGAGEGGQHGHGSMSPFNVSTVLAFLTWFGGVGYLLSKLSALPALAVLGLSSLGGLAGATVVFILLARVMMAGQTAPLRDEDYRIQGTLARVSLPMSGTGTGEVVYTKHGTTRSEGARSADGSPLPRGTEVVILRYERGIAYVEPLDKLLAERTPPRLHEGGESAERS